MHEEYIHLASFLCKLKRLKLIEFFLCGFLGSSWATFFFTVFQIKFLSLQCSLPLPSLPPSPPPPYLFIFLYECVRFSSPLRIASSFSRVFFFPSLIWIRCGPTSLSLASPPHHTPTPHPIPPNALIVQRDEAKKNSSPIFSLASYNSNSIFFPVHVVLLETRIIKPTFNRLIPTIFSSPLKSPPKFRSHTLFLAVFNENNLPPFF